MPIQDLREFFRESPFRVFREIVANGGTVRGFVVRNAGGYSRSEVDGIVDQAKTLGATGLVWARRLEDGAVTSSIMKAMGEEAVCPTARHRGRCQWRAAVDCCGRAGLDVKTARSAEIEPGEEGRAAPF